jgi:beta-carotene 15,15'-dioxygenase
LTIILYKTNLIWGFAIYFVFWHSLPSMKAQVVYLYEEYTYKNFLKYCQSAFIYWLLAILFLGIIYFYFKESSFFVAIFFSFLSAITFPHVLVIHHIMQKKPS